MGGVNFEIRACLGVHRAESIMGCGFGVSGFLSPSRADGGCRASCLSRSRSIVALLLRPLEKGSHSWNPFLQSPQMLIKVSLGRQHSFRSYGLLRDAAPWRQLRVAGAEWHYKG